MKTNDNHYVYKVEKVLERQSANNTYHVSIELANLQLCQVEALAMLIDSLEKNGAIFEKYIMEND